MKAVGISPSIMYTEEKMHIQLHSEKKKETRILQKQFKPLYSDGYLQLPITLNLSNMKSNINSVHYFIGFLCLAITLFSCEKVIKLDLNKDDPKIIIEAAFEVDSLNQVDSSTQYVYIRRTVNFDTEINGLAVDNASITLTDGVDTIKSTANSYKGDGKYELKIRKGFVTESKTFSLFVKVDNKVYSAISKCPANAVPLDSIGVFKQKSFGRYNYSIAPIRNETPAGIPNWYQFKAKKNGVKINKILVDDDQNLDGVMYTRKPIFELNEFSPDTIVKNVTDQPKFIAKKDGVVTLEDSVEIELTLVNIEYKVYRYLFNLVLNQGGRQSATPSNPDPIFSNGALGYFSVQKSYTRKKWINNK